MIRTTRSEELLTRVDLFAGLGRIELAKLAAYLESVEVAQGQEVVRQGEPGDSLYIVTGACWACSWLRPTAAAPCAWLRWRAATCSASGALHGRDTLGDHRRRSAVGRDPTAASVPSSCARFASGSRARSGATG